MTQVIYIIPARGGSKGLPGKNLQRLGDKPLIAWTIEAALNASVKGKVVVSTDSPEIAAIARALGAEVPFMRPDELASDTASTMDVVFHALEWYKKNNEHFSTVVLLQPTSPLRNASDIDTALVLMKNKNAGSVVSVSECAHHPLWANTLAADGSMKGFLKEEVKGKNRQQLPVYYQLNGAIYISDTEKLYRNKNFLNDETLAYIMPAERSVDVDSELDLLVAGQLILKKG